MKTTLEYQKNLQQRTTKCKACGKLMYYAEHPHYEAEIEVEYYDELDENKSYYIHLKCWKKLLKMMKEKG